MSSPSLRFIAPMPRLTGGSQAWVRELRHIEDLGFHAVAVSEHYTHGWAMDALTAMNFALSATTRLHVIPLVLNNDLHHPAVLAKAVATADVLSVGRAAVGIGAGWLADDYEALGVAYEPAALRIARLDEALDVITAFFAHEHVTFHGQHYQVNDLEALPHPAPDSKPLLLVGGGGPMLLDVAARHADIVGIHPRLRTNGFDQRAAQELTGPGIREKIGSVVTAATRAGRRVPEFQFTCYDVNVGGVQVTPVRPNFTGYIDSHAASFADSPVSLRGDVDKCIDELIRWKEELGISYWNLGGNVTTLAPIIARLSAE